MRPSDVIRAVTSLASFSLASMMSVGVDAQLPEGGWLTGTNSSVLNFFTPALVPSQTVQNGWVSVSGGAAVDGRRFIYTAEPALRVYRVSFDPGLSAPNQLVLELPGALLPGPSTVANSASGLAALHDRLWGVCPSGRLFSIDKSINNQIPVLHTNVKASPPIYGEVRSACSNGRELFFVTGMWPSTPVLAQNEIWAVDLRAPNFPKRQLGIIPGDHCPVVSLGREGEILVMRYDGLYRVDPIQGGVSFVSAKPTHANFTRQGGQTSGTILLAYDPWTDRVAIGPTWVIDTTHIEWKQRSTNPPWSQAYYFPFFSTLRKFANASEQPFELLGTGCLNGLGKEPRMGWQGLPMQGQGFTLKVRDAEPNGFAFFWVGQSDTFWQGLGALPFDAAVFGAPGCRILCSSDFCLAVPVDANGDASLTIPVPVNQSLHGFQVFAQTASTSGGNSLGLAASDAMVIRLR